MEQAIVDLLSDGNPRTKKQLKAHLNDELMEDKALAIHILNIRVKVNPIGHEIACISRGKAGIYYRHVRLLHLPSPKD